MGVIVYARPEDNIASDATVVVEGGSPSIEDPEYPAENLVNLDVSNPAKLTDTAGGWVFDFGAPVTLQAVALLNHNLDTGLDVLLQGNAADAWGAPTFEEAFTIPADEADDFSVNPWLDLSASPQTFQFWRVWVNAANSADVAIGEVVMVETLRTLPHDWQVVVGLEESEEIPDIIHQSGFGGRTAYAIGAKWKVWDGGMAITMADDHWALARGARGRTRPWFFVPDRDVNSSYLVTFDWTGPRVTLRRVIGTLVSVPAFRLREVSRGVPL